MHRPLTFSFSIPDREEDVAFLLRAVDTYLRSDAELHS